MSKSIKDLQMLSANEENILKEQFNSTYQDYPKDKCIHTLFEEQVLKTPDKTAVIACDKTLTYDELNKLSNRIANSLIQKGIGVGDIVAFALPRRSYLIATMLGIIKSGAAYMPLDPSYPKDRINYMLNDGKAKLFITEDNIEELLNCENENNPDISITQKDIYCALHTSGSTGLPKMSALKHEGIMNFYNGTAEFFQNIEMVVSATIVTFDAFILDTIISISKGITLYLASEKEIFNQIKFENIFVGKNNIMFFSTPTKLKSYIKNSYTKEFVKSISSFVLGGEMFSNELYQLIKEYSNDSNIFNIYGPTETTICVTYDKIPEESIYMAKSIKDLRMLSANEENILKEQFNNTYQDYPRDKCVHTLFEEIAESKPDKIALEFNGKEYSYALLNNMANNMAEVLISKGVKKGDIVAIISERSYHIIVAMLAIFKVGAAYVPIDSNYPIDRIEHIIKDSNCSLVLSYGIDNPAIDTVEIIADCKTKENPNIDISPKDLCCVIYTSGSTGKPKGTLLHHKGIVNYCFGNDALYQGGSCVIGFAMLSFDAFFLDTLIPMIREVKCVLTTKDEQFVQADFERVIIEHPKCNFFITPAKFKQFIDNKINVDFLKNVNKICIGGEVFPEEILEFFDDKTEVFNVYGPTECSMWTSGSDNINLQKTSIKKYFALNENDSAKLEQFNNTYQDYPKDMCVHQLFEEQVLKTPDKSAVIACDKTLTYDELNKLSNRIANSLIQKGIGVGDIVAFALPRRSYLIATMFGILKSGAAYMPLDPSYPKDRIDYMLNDSKAKLFITEDNIEELLNCENENNPDISITQKDIYCALHTSGSTGKPKLALLTHKNLMAFLYANHIFYDDCDATITVTIATFDVFMQDTVLSIAYGVKTILSSEDQIYNQYEFEKLFLLADRALFFSTPTKLKNYIIQSETKEFLNHIGTFVVGGEVFPEELYELIISHLDKSKCYNGYGPTETTLCNSCSCYPPRKFITVMDQQKQPLEVPMSTYTKIYNIYGPTETTILSTNVKINEVSTDENEYGEIHKKRK